MRKLLALVILVSCASWVLPFAGSVPAWAKSVSVDWKAIRGARSYELQIERDGKVVLTEKTKSPSWSGDLPPGPYTYRIRGIDRISRPGKWSEPKALVAAPKPPELHSPINDRKIAIYHPDAPVTLKWQKVEGISRYAVTVRSGETIVYKGDVTGTELPLSRLPAGDYRWQVATIVEASSREPASGPRKTWKGEPSDAEEFRINVEKLAAPNLIYPNSVVPPGRDGKMQFEWSAVEGAEAYEVTIQDLPRGRSPASGPARSQVFVTKETSLKALLPGEGKSVWKVRALAHVDASKVPLAVGPHSTMNYRVSRNAAYFDGSGYVALSSLFSPYTYRGWLSENTNNGSVESISLTTRLSGEYWFHPQWAFGAGAEMTSFQINSAMYNRDAYELMVKFRMNLNRDKYAWFISPKVGVELRDYFRVRRESGATVLDSLTTYGASVGVDVRKAFNTKFSLGVKIGIYYPLGTGEIPAYTVSSGGFTESVSAGSLVNRGIQNMSIGIQGLYWLTEKWGVGLGIFQEGREISYRSTRSNTGFSEERDSTINTDATHVFGSVIYSFGK